MRPIQYMLFACDGVKPNITFSTKYSGFSYRDGAGFLWWKQFHPLLLLRWIQIWPEGDWDPAQGPHTGRRWGNTAVQRRLRKKWSQPVGGDVTLSKEGRGGVREGWLVWLVSLEALQQHFLSFPNYRLTISDNCRSLKGTALLESVKLCLTLSLPSSKSTFSQPFKRETYEWCSENW